MKILIVDDHPIVLLFYENILKEHYFNCDIVKAANCEEAYFAINGIFENKDFDIAIVDQRLPCYLAQNLYSGCDIVNLIRKTDKLTKVILITGLDKKLLIYDIIKKVRPDGIAIKSDITNENFIEIITTVLNGNKYQSHIVKDCISEIWDNKIIADDYNRKIILQLINGYKISDLHKFIPLSESAINKRITSIKKSFQISGESNLINEILKRGFM